MRKLVIFLTIFMLAGPMLGFLCHCCPMAFADDSSVPVLTGEGCDCCPGPIQMNEKKQATGQIGFSFQILHRAFQTIFAAALPAGGLPDFSRSLEPKNSDPPVSSSIPLHLSLQVLRI